MIFILIFADGTANSCLRPSVAPPGDKGYNEGAITQDSSKGGNPYAHHKKIPAVLTIAGSDCSGGAGIQADIKTMTMHGVYAMSAITALTAQNTQQVTGILPVPPAFLAEQLEAIFTDIRPQAVKIGMVADPELIHIIAQTLEKYQAEHIVIDPVMAASSGSPK